MRYAQASKDTTENEIPSEKASKGIRAGNVIVINDGTVNVKSDGDALHVRKQAVLGNGASAVGNMTVNGGVLTLESGKNGLYAEGFLKIVGGEINVIGAQNGFRAAFIDVYRGKVSIRAKEIGMYAVSDDGDALKIRGGSVYILSEGSGLRSDSQSEWGGMLFSGGHTVILSSTASAIRTVRGYVYEGGHLSCPYAARRGRRCHESLCVRRLRCIDRNNLDTGGFLTAKIGEENVTVRISFTLEAAVLAFGDCFAEFDQLPSCTVELDHDGVAWQ